MKGRPSASIQQGQVGPVVQRWNQQGGAEGKCQSPEEPSTAARGQAHLSASPSNQQGLCKTSGCQGEHCFLSAPPSRHPVNAPPSQPCSPGMGKGTWITQALGQFQKPLLLD